MLHSVAYLCTLCVVEAVKCTYQIACDSADTLEAVFPIGFASAAFRAGVPDDAVIAADGITVNGWLMEPADALRPSCSG